MFWAKQRKPSLIRGVTWVGPDLFWRVVSTPVEEMVVCRGHRIGLLSIFAVILMLLSCDAAPAINEVNHPKSTSFNEKELRPKTTFSGSWGPEGIWPFSVPRLLEGLCRSFFQMLQFAFFAFYYYAMVWFLPTEIPVLLHPSSEVPGAMQRCTNETDIPDSFSYILLF